MGLREKLVVRCWVREDFWGNVDCVGCIEIGNLGLRGGVAREAGRAVLGEGKIFGENVDCVGCIEIGHLERRWLDIYSGRCV